MSKFYCTRCNKTYTIEDYKKCTEPIMKCKECGGIIRPDIVMYGEWVAPSTRKKLEKDIKTYQDTVIVIGSSLE